MNDTSRSAVHTLAVEAATIGYDDRVVVHDVNTNANGLSARRDRVAFMPSILPTGPSGAYDFFRRR